MRIQNILQNVRDILADPDKTRWQDEQLIRFVSEGHRELAKLTQHHRGRINIPLLRNQHTYNLPEDLLLILDVWFKGLRLPVVSISEIEKGRINRPINTFSRFPTTGTIYTEGTLRLSAAWRDDDTEGDIKCIITENVNYDSFRVYPIPSNPSLPCNAEEIQEKIDTAEFIKADEVTKERRVPKDWEGQESEKMMFDEEVIRLRDSGKYDELQRYIDENGYVYQYDGETCGEGILYNIKGGSFYEDIDNGDSGFISNILETDYVTMSYSKLPPLIDSVKDSLSCKPAYDIAIQFYVLHKAYLGDTTVGSVEQGNYYYARFKEQVTMAQKDAQLNNVATSHHQTTYRPLG